MNDHIFLPLLLQEEKEYIEWTIPSRDEGRSLPSPPWKHFFTSIPFIALIIAHTCHNWGFNTLLTMVPTYLYNIQHFDLTTVDFTSLNATVSTLVLAQKQFHLSRMASYLPSPTWPCGCYRYQWDTLQTTSSETRN